MPLPERHLPHQPCSPRTPRQDRARNALKTRHGPELPEAQAPATSRRLVPAPRPNFLSETAPRASFQRPARPPVPGLPSAACPVPSGWWCSVRQAVKGSRHSSFSRQREAGGWLAGALCQASAEQSGTTRVHARYSRLRAPGTGGQAQPTWALKWLLGPAPSYIQEAQLGSCSLYSVAEA